MTNADQPAFPAEGRESEGRFLGVQTTDTSGIFGGLTKRELFAAMAMQGIISRGERVPDKKFVDGRTVICNPDDLAKLSIECSTELLRQLETTK